MTFKRPVYLEIPRDMVYAEIEEAKHQPFLWNGLCQRRWKNIRSVLVKFLSSLLYAIAYSLPLT
ncbi:hypothetical protein IQ249_22185 [Lusitaniella coriacea LEGE 07157]|uniref:Uncharacterized protein n=1 Tax=Lusitaniella coriacea LEGE 07157 TaxID=945747 RepID=A0A8J7E1P4_9CYAN|nr:hypothetical protein [Lusitaniella coriacea]MBE9118602.1 hypothetical protein [Lusitaniella coriacea LEGE 07157]